MSRENSKSGRSSRFGELVQLNISGGGMPKRAIDSAHVTVAGLPGDWQKNRKYHGGPDRAICLFSEEQYNWLRDEFQIDLPSGSVGENFTTRGLDLNAMNVGDRLRVGDTCLIEITDVRTPCKSLSMWHADLQKVIKGRSGWVARVLVPGEVRTGDRIEYIDSGAEKAVVDTRTGSSLRSR